MIDNIKLGEALELKIFNLGEAKDVECGYCGDLLSWVMGKAESGCAWLTVMNNINVAAVAVLRDVACVILCEGVNPDENLLKRAQAEGITLYGSCHNSYELSVKVAELLKEQA